MVQRGRLITDREGTMDGKERRVEGVGQEVAKIRGVKLRGPKICRRQVELLPFYVSKSLLSRSEIIM